MRGWLLCFALGVFGGNPSRVFAQSLAYDSLLARARAQDSTLDMVSLRLAFTRTDKYAPYGDRETDAHTAIYSALDRQDLKHALALVDSLLEVNFVDIEGHMAGALVAEQLGDSGRARFESWMTTRLMQSIARSGQGTEDAPYVVISIGEEYAFALLSGLRRAGPQSLGPCGAAVCDRTDFEDRRTGRKVTLVFDVSLAKAWYDRQGQR